MKTATIHMDNDVPSVQSFVDLVHDYLSTVDIVEVLSRRSLPDIVADRVGDIRRAIEALQESLDGYNSYSSDWPASPASVEIAESVDDRHFVQDPRAAGSDRFPALSETAEPRRLTFLGIGNNPEWLEGASRFESIPCDYTAYHYFCRWCAIPQHESHLIWHEEHCGMNPHRDRVWSKPEYPTKICDFCKYEIPSEHLEEHILERCVYNGAPNQPWETLPKPTRVLTEEEFRSQNGAGQENPAYIAHACFNCGDDEKRSNCDRTFGCQNCRARKELCEYDLGNDITVSISTIRLGHARITYDDLELLKMGDACTKCEEDGRPCVRYGSEPCLYCTEHWHTSCKFVQSKHEDTSTDIKGVAHLYGAVESTYNDNKLMEVRKQRQAIMIAQGHARAAEAALLRQRKEMKKAKKMEKAKAAEESNKVENAKATKQIKQTKKVKQSKTKATATTTRKQQKTQQPKETAAGSGTGTSRSSNAGTVKLKVSEPRTADDEIGSEIQSRDKHMPKDIATGSTRDPGTAEPSIKKRSATDMLSAPAKRAKSSDDAFRGLLYTDLGDPTGLPPGWGSYQHHKTGKTYYVHHHTRTTTWEKPK